MNRGRPHPLINKVSRTDAEKDPNVKPMTVIATGEVTR